MPLGQSPEHCGDVEMQLATSTPSASILSYVGASDNQRKPELPQLADHRAQHRLL